jgi:DNA-binding response OmpR family regulator
VATITDVGGLLAPIVRHPRGRLLVIEDEWLISTHLCEYLREIGYEVVGPAGTISEAIRVASHADIDVALVDLKLRDVLAIDVVNILVERQIPFVFVTGFNAVPESVNYTPPIVEKPFRGDELVRAIESVRVRRP